MMVEQQSLNYFTYRIIATKLQFKYREETVRL